MKTSFGIGYAFLGNDLGVDLYRNIDSGIVELESANYAYELKGQKSSGTIEDEFNRILLSKGYGDCKISGTISPEEFEKLSSGDIALLKEKLSPECGEEEYAVSTINGISSQLKDFKNNTLLKAQEKSKQTYDISRIGLYVDGDLQNSPFDLIQDIKDINYIVFTEEIEYRGEKSIDDDDFADFLGGKFKDIPEKLNADIKSSNAIEEINEALGAGSDGDTEELTTGGGNNMNATPIEPYYFGGDQTQYVCAQETNNSGLSQEEVNNLLQNNNNGSSNYGGLGGEQNNSTLSEGIILGGINVNYEGGYSEDITYSTLDTQLEEFSTGYQKVTDDSQWECSNFFCITIDFVIYNHNALGGSELRSIQSIVELSNEHLKKFANASLIQSKMTTNNFEIGLRDLDLAKIFSGMGFVVTKKTPPILALEKFYDDPKQVEENERNSGKNLHCKRLEALGLNCKWENDLAFFQDRDYEERAIQDSAELPLSELTKKMKAREIFRKQQALSDEFIDKSIQRDNQINETDGLYKEFLELERFVGNMKDYAVDLKKSIKLMNEIPIHP